MTVFVSDPFGITGDASLPFAAAALNPAEAERAMQRLRLPAGTWQLQSILVTRHKPGRRCLIEYRLTNSRGDVTVLIGKMRAKGADLATYSLARALWNDEFADTSADGISVPEPVGVVAEFGMWLQRKVPGHTVTRLLEQGESITWAARAAEAIHKLHESATPVSRSHTLADELAIINRLLSTLAEQRPSWSRRLHRLADGCHRLAATIVPTAYTVIHRDYYPDQVLGTNERLYLLDLDLCCNGDPALDAGNLIGHLIERGLRDPTLMPRMAAAAAEFERRFAELTCRDSNRSVRQYALLTLARHVGLSPRFPDRQPTTDRLLRYCERALAGGES